MKKGVLEEIADEYSIYRDKYGNDIKPRWNLVENLNLDAGDWIEWCYQEDIDFYKEENLTNDWMRKNMPYRGLLVQLPDSEHFCIEENAVVMITKYPCEKTNCEIDYVSLIKLINFDDIAVIYKSKR